MPAPRPPVLTDLSAGDAVLDGFQEARLRGGVAWSALRGQRIGPPRANRQWPWAMLAAATGAAAGVATVLLVRRLSGEDHPGAQEPEDLQAVVDRSPI